MDRAVENNGGLTLRLAPKVNTSDGVAIARCARGDNLSVGSVLADQVLHPSKMVPVRVVGLEPGSVGASDCNRQCEIQGICSLFY